VDRERILARLGQLDQYLRELRQIAPATLAAYQALEKKRACERLAQIAVEAALDVCALLVRELRLGLPAEEDDVLTKLLEARVLSPDTVAALRRMKGVRNVLVHEYGAVDDRIVYEVVAHRMTDLAKFGGEVRALLAKRRED
jgi:uncharacterized protein YutE (UPF0331/DUF86 family)